MNAKLAKSASLVISILMLISLFFTPARVTAQDDPVRLLASTLKLDPASLTLQDSTTVTLLNGRQILRVKAFNQKTGEGVGADFENGIPVDFQALQAEAGRQWRADHGALTPATLAGLAQYSPDDRLKIAIWLAGEITPLERPAMTFELSLEERFSTQGTSTPDAEDNSLASSGTYIDGKPIAAALSPQEYPPEVLAATHHSSTNAIELEKTPEEIAAADKSKFENLPAADASGVSAAYDVANSAYLQNQVQTLQDRFIQHANSAGLYVTSIGDGIPTAYLEDVPRSLVEEMAFWPEIDAIYLVPENAGPALEDARPAQNAVLVNNVGYNGNGVNIGITEGERIFFANPALTIHDCFNCSADYANHPTAVAGFIKSTATGYNGLANGATVDSANGSYSDWATMANAIAWATNNDKILNNSWYWDSSNSPVFWEADRRLDYIVRYNADLVTVAAGNFGNGCGGNFSSYVTSPAKGYNVLTVGNYEDVDNVSWSDDAMSSCSSFGNPGSDTASPTHEKPEVAAIGSTLDSTLTNTSDPLIGSVGSGTSYSSPMVAALGADLMQAKSTLVNYPEAAKALIMATALHNIEGSARLSDKDGTGGVDFTAALTSAEREHFDGRSISSSTTYPITFTVHAYQGERVRFVTTWDSNPTSDYTSDPLPADLDLYAYRANGTTIVTSSTSSYNNFEIVDFIAPATETYVIKVTNASYTGSSTYLGSGWWRGEYRINDDVGYSDPMATPLGTQLSVYPTGLAPSNYWRAMGIRPSASDHDLYLYSAALYADPSNRIILASSSYGSTSIDYIVVDGNHRSSEEHYRVNHYSGTGGYAVTLSNPGIALSTGVYGPYTLATFKPVQIFDLYLYKGQAYKVTIIPTTSGTINASDLAVFLHRSILGNAASYTRSRSYAVAQADSSTLVTASETFTYAPATSDWFGLVVASKTADTASFYIKINTVVNLPAIMR